MTNECMKIGSKRNFSLKHFSYTIIEISYGTIRSRSIQWIFCYCAGIILKKVGIFRNLIHLPFIHLHIASSLYIAESGPSQLLGKHSSAQACASTKVGSLFPYSYPNGTVIWHDGIDQDIDSHFGVPFENMKPNNIYFPQNPKSRTRDLWDDMPIVLPLGYHSYHK